MGEAHSQCWDQSWDQMNMERKLIPLLKAAQAAEHEALRERKKIEEIVSVRREIVEKLIAKQQALNAQFEKITNHDKRHAMMQGNISQVRSISSYEQRLQTELRQVASALQQRQSELHRALERAQMAEADALQASIERRKLEQLLGSQERIRLITDVAQEESFVDDFSNQRERK